MIDNEMPRRRSSSNDNTYLRPKLHLETQTPKGRISTPIERTAAPPLIGMPICGARRHMKRRSYNNEMLDAEHVRAE